MTVQTFFQRISKFDFKSEKSPSKGGEKGNQNKKIKKREKLRLQPNSIQFVKRFFPLPPLGGTDRW
jgi:hypothetical protein